MRRIKSFFLVILLVFTVLSLSSCKKEQYVDVKSMNTITFMVDGTQFGKSYIITGEQGKAIAGPVLEGRKFLYWGIDGIQFDFSNPITENIILNAYFEEAATIVITDHIDLNNLENAKFIISNDVIKGSVVKCSLIKPGVDGSCYFYLSNQTVNDLTFKLTLSERNVVGIPLQYNFRSITSTDSTRIWKNISELKDIEITIPATSRILFSLDWVWQHIENPITEIYVNEAGSYVEVTFTYNDLKKAE